MNDSHDRVQSPEVARPSAAARRHTEFTNADAEQLAQIMQALASPLRLRILSALRAQPRTVTELSEILDAGQTTVSNHMRLLRHLSLVTGRREGRHVHYALFDNHVNDLLEEAIGHLAHLTRNG
ncbi:MAG: metalloregulator ArsR/SmtB family transcription factor [Actinomycetota bacterium]